jgi:hypothetical protein
LLRTGMRHDFDARVVQGVRRLPCHASIARCTVRTAFNTITATSTTVTFTVVSSIHFRNHYRLRRTQHGAAAVQPVAIASTGTVRATPSPLVCSSSLWPPQTPHWQQLLLPSPPPQSPTPHISCSCPCQNAQLSWGTWVQPAPRPPSSACPEIVHFAACADVMAALFQ